MAALGAQKVNLMDKPTKTSQDAFLRVLDMRTGMLAFSPTEEYLVALRNELFKCVDSVEQELATVQARPKPHLVK